MSLFFKSKKSTYFFGSGVLLAMCLMLIASAVFSGEAHANVAKSQMDWFLAHHSDDQWDDNQNLAGNANNALSAQAYDNAAYPNTYVSYDQTTGAYNAYQRLSNGSFGYQREGSSWKLVGPTTVNESGLVTYTHTASQVSGRVTALAIASDCDQSHCQVYLGAAGGGVWKSENALATRPDWDSISNGLASNAIGSLEIDPSSKDGRVLYVGTGEQNGSSDSEAGVGLYKSTDFGEHWSLVTGSVAAAAERAIGAIAVDPSNPNHIYIGTSIARHGASAVNGGRFTPPGAPTIGLYESTNGGQTFSLVYHQTVDTNSSTGTDYYRGGVSKILFASGEQIYFTMNDYGLFRNTTAGTYEQVFAAAGGGTYANGPASRTEFALAPLANGNLRIYVGDVSNSPAALYRVDNAGVAASTLTNGTNNPGWTALSSSTPGNPGYGSYNFTESQGWYDMWVASPAGHPDTVWIGGSMEYGEISSTSPSNGRAVMRSTDAGVNFTDMTNDSQASPDGLHPDQHAVVFDPENPDIAFLGDDGGVVRTSGSFADTSSTCAARGVTGADLTDCLNWLSAIPTKITEMNAGLATLQFGSITVNPANPTGDIMGGTQDNGTLVSTGSSTWTESVGGDGGNSAYDATNSNIRMHTYYGPSPDVNFHGSSASGWDWTGDPLYASGESASFYIPLISDPTTSGSFYAGLQHVWRTTDSGGSQSYLDSVCNEYTGTFASTCGDWVPLGSATLTGSTYGTDKYGSYVVAITRAPSNTSTMWAATRLGRVFISTNANAADATSVAFTRIDTSAQPGRFVSGIAVDPKNSNHAIVAFSGYNAYTPTTTGHVFDVVYNPTTGTATWTDISANVGDQPVTGVAFDGSTIYLATDYGVLVKRPWSDHWENAAPGLPMVAVYGITLSIKGHVLYAATHGRGAYVLKV